MAPSYYYYYYYIIIIIVYYHYEFIILKWRLLCCTFTCFIFVFFSFFLNVYPILQFFFYQLPFFPPSSEERIKVQFQFSSTICDTSYLYDYKMVRSILVQLLFRYSIMNAATFRIFQFSNGRSSKENTWYDNLYFLLSYKKKKRILLKIRKEF